MIKENKIKLLLSVLSVSILVIFILIGILFRVNLVRSRERVYQSPLMGRVTIAYVEDDIAVGVSNVTKIIVSDSKNEMIIYYMADNVIEKLIISRQQFIRAYYDLNNHYDDWIEGPWRYETN